MDNQNPANFITEDEVNQLEADGKIAPVENSRPIVPSEIAAAQTPMAERYLSASIAPALQYQPDLIKTEYQTVPSVRVMPVSPAGLPSINAAINSVVSTALESVAFGLVMPKEYAVSDQGKEIVVTWVPEESATALMGPIPTSSPTFATPYVNYSYSNSSLPTLTPSWPTWSTNINYSVSNIVASNTSGRIIDSNGNIQTVVTSGTSTAGSHPTWNTQVGGLTTDNTVVWRNDGPGANIFSKGDILVLLTSVFNVSVNGITDTMGNYWQLVTTPLGFTDYINGKTVGMYVWYTACVKDLANGGSYTISIEDTSGSGGAINQCVFMNMSGVASVLLPGINSGATGNLPGANPNPFTPGSITTTTQQVLLDVVFADATIAGGPPSWLTAAGNPGSGAFNTGIYFLDAAAGSYNPATDGFPGAVSTYQNIVFAVNIGVTYNLAPGSGTPGFRDITNIDLSNAIFGPSGSNHNPGAVPDPGPYASTTRFLNETGAWENVVSSITLQVPDIFSLTGELTPSYSQTITSSGTFDITLANETSHYFFGGPDTGTSGQPTFRAIEDDDLPSSVVTTIVDDTNVTGVISNQTLTLGWANELSPARGGTGSNLSSTGGTGQYLKQTSTGADITVGTISSSDVVLASPVVKTSSYNFAIGDSGSLFILNTSSASTFTLLGTAPTNWFVFIKNLGTGILTVARNSLTIDGKSQNLTLLQSDGCIVTSDGSNYWTGQPRPVSLAVFMPGTGSNGQILFYNKLDRPTVFPANAPNSFGVAKAAATGSTTFTFKQNGSSFATAVFSVSGTTASFTQASDATFAVGDILEIDGPGTADSTLANMGLTLQGYRF